MNTNSNESELTRRQFIKATGQAAALTAVAASTWGCATAKSTAPANPPLVHMSNDETLKLALVGCGGRGSGAADQALSTKGSVKLVAMADTFDVRLENSLKALADKHPDQVDADNIEKHVGFDAYKKAIAAADVVILATSPGFRSFHFEEAVNQGKHIFMEKPLGTDAPGVRRILAANKIAKEKNLKVGVGYQRHHQLDYLEMYKRVKDGAIGDILAMRVYWRGGSRGGEVHRPNETEMQYQIRNWYFFTYLSGDHIVEQHCHNIDVGNWFKGAHPIRANGVGGRQSRTQKECGQIFDHHYVEFEYADGCRMFSQCSQFRPGWGNVSEHLIGSKGLADLQDKKSFSITGKHPWKFKGNMRNAYQVEHDDLFAAIRANQPYNEADYGAYSTMTAIMGRMATYSGQEVQWNEAFNCETELISKPIFDWHEDPPVMPGPDGTYPTFHPGKTPIC